QPGGCQGVNSYAQALLLGVFLGFARAPFAVALPLASEWLPPQHTGMAVLIAGPRERGPVLGALFALCLAAAFGWNRVF
ncbi:MFS transporter, partial [Pseudomonas aeruginosa]